MEGSEDEEEVNYVQANDHQRENQPGHQRDDQNDHQQQQQCTSFEEQFRQLYELSPDPKRKEFLDNLFSFMSQRGTPVNRIPIMAKQVLDLFELYRLVVTHGGLVEVINKKIWREITKGLNLPSSITSAAFTLRTQYMKYLYPYECEKEQLSTPEELQQAIDGNKREGRRSSNGHYLDVGESSVGAGGSGSGNALSNAILFNGGPSNVGPSNGRPTNGGLASLGISSIQPLSLVKRSSTATNSGTSSSEEDNVSIHSLPINPLLALASAQAEALNLENKRIMNGRKMDLNSNSQNRQGNSTSSFKVNGYSNGDSNNNIELDAHGTKRNLSDEERLLINAGMPAIHIKIPNREGRSSSDNSMFLTIEIDNNLYSGVLYPKPKK